MGIIGIAGEIFFEDKVVAHFKDGRVVKGHTRDFSPARDSFTLQPYVGESGPVPVFLDELKAVFHVRTFEGNPAHPRPKGTVGEIGEARFTKVMEQGRRVALQFQDGERLWGYAESHGDRERGFFFFPTDPGDNNLRVYVVKSSLKEMVFLEA
ncbi:MAG TPA: hypothetical protein VJV23_15605 [Candidatus Polarisedimenticolia bacterium]|nr:hypothetical protein [Candidatus Polarisedimenticolia bacterium]